MATNQSSDSTTSTDETSNEDNTNTDDTSTGETSDQDTTGDNTADQDDTSSDSTDDKDTAPKPKPKSDPAKQALQRDLSTERKEHKTSKARVAELEAQVADLSPKAETGEAWQAKYDRLEEFLTSLDGPIGKVLDSRSFTKALFESDQDVKDILKDWNKANPSATSTALGAGSADPASKKPDMNTLLRAAIKG